MPSKKPPIKTAPVIEKTSSDETIDASELELPLALDKVALAKKRYQPRFPNPWGQHKAKKIGNAPRGTRKSMGKR